MQRARRFRQRLIEGIGHGVLYGNDGGDTLKHCLDQYGGLGADRFICDPAGDSLPSSTTIKRRAT
ncbi:hypothetical protein [Candidatus Nitrososphaera gargensis]|uniref:hypothetical protein n=1 Tax=Candidatus Nitrososphaera gargensis TaxID=497727 RepID=UPI0011E4F121|nr:hypothetical protein [Candidatus Nitrososphaera gargensis]